MDSSGLLLTFRRQVFDLVAPYLWSDEEAFQFMTDAQAQFCRLTGGIVDSTSDAALIEITAGDKWADFHPAVLEIKAARRVSDGRTIEWCNIQNLPSRAFGDDYGQPRSYSLTDLQPGTPRLLVTDMEPDKVRVVPVPDQNETIELTVHRLPIKDITAPLQKLEVPAIHHLCLVDWMKHRAYQKQDAETRNDKRSQEGAMAFQLYCQQARVDRERREHKPRAVQYGGY